ncbi:MAG: hypothetical protein DBY36_01420 [Clostridiales bacterium]|nr:MAG: hypothetical protein DBY36_01420 [Clostridiales bacterium]
MNWLQKFMYGRYGADQLTLLLLALYFVLALVCAIFRLPYLWILAFIPLGYAFWRMMSRSVDKRRAENMKFLSLWRRLTGGFRRRKQQRQDKEHVYFKCKKCGATLRLPRGVGNVVVTCPRCGAKAEGKA